MTYEQYKDELQWIRTSTREIRAEFEYQLENLRECLDKANLAYGEDRECWLSTARRWIHRISKTKAISFTYLSYRSRLVAWFHGSRIGDRPSLR